MPESVLIKYDRCKLNLVLPIYFEEQSVAKIHEVFKLLSEYAWQNEADWNADGYSAWEVLDRFFATWKIELMHRLNRVEADLITAKRTEEEKRRTVAALGSVLDYRINQASEQVKLARRCKKSDPKTYERCQQNYEIASRPKVEHKQATKEVKRLQSAVKRAKAAVKRGGKIIDAYTTLKASKN